MKGAIAEYKQRQRLPPAVDDESVRSRLSRGLAPPRGDVTEEEHKLPEAKLQAAARLIVETGPQAGAVLELTDEPVTLGADDGCSLRLADEGGRVAAEHARIWWRQGRFVIRQLVGGHPCIVVEGQAIPWALLEDGDRIEIGEHVLRFQLLESSA
jgi:predicted component of type VI protein secretion system